MGENILIHLFCSYEFKEEHALPWGLDNKVLRLLMSLGMSLSLSLPCSALHLLRAGGETATFSSTQLHRLGVSEWVHSQSVPQQRRTTLRSGYPYGYTWGLICWCWLQWEDVLSSLRTPGDAGTRTAVSSAGPLTAIALMQTSNLSSLYAPFNKETATISPSKRFNIFISNRIAHLWYKSPVSTNSYLEQKTDMIYR